MLHIHRATVDLVIEPGEGRSIVSALQARGWVPLGLEADQVAAKLAGLSQEQVGEEPLRLRSGANGQVGDVFFHDDGVYYLVTTDEGATRRPLFFAADVPEQPERSGQNGNNLLEIGLVSQQAEAIDDRLARFGATVGDAVHEVLGDRRGANGPLRWQGVGPGTNSVRQLADRLAEQGTAVQLTEPELGADAVAAAGVLEDPGLRALLSDLTMAGGFALESDLMRSRERTSDDDLTMLVRHGLLTKSYVVLCQESQRPLTRVADPGSFRDSGAAGLDCATCGRKFADEQIASGVAVTDLGTRFIRGGHWMTVWVTAKLVDLGIPLESIRWNLADTADEIDIVADYLGHLWVLELKDRDVDQHDAHALNYRRVWFHPDVTLVVTTGTVAADARRVFDEVARQNDDRRRRVPGAPSETGLAVPPVYAEGLDAVSAVLADEIERGALFHVERHLGRAAVCAGLAPAPLLSAAQAWGPAALAPDAAPDGDTVS